MADPKEQKEIKEQKQSTAVAIQERNISDGVLKRIKDMESQGLKIPANYVAENALKSAWLIIQNTKDKNGKFVLDVCTKDSIANALLDMVIQGLSPVKKQCYFIARGNQLYLDRSYFGTVAVTKKLNSITDVFAECIYQGDTFKYHIDINTGLKVIDAHDQDFANIDPAKITGAYAVILRDGKPAYVEVMNMAQIKKAWDQGPMGGTSPAHKNFPDQMAMRTVLNRACKLFLNTSDDSDILINSIVKTTPHEDIPEAPFEILEDEISDKANKEELKITPAKIEAPKPEPVEAGKNNGTLFQDNEKAPF